MKTWGWHNAEKETPELTHETDWGEESDWILGDYGEDEEYRFCQLQYEKILDEDGDYYQWSSPDGEEVAPPERWTYIGG